MVRAIRQFRPHIIVSVWSGDPRDGHGHHQACGILAKEAFFAARDGNRFPELAQEGLAPWRVQKLYIRVYKADESSFAINTGQYIPLFGTSFQEIAALGYSLHRSQGNGDTYALPGDYDSYFRLAYPDVPDDSGFFDNLALKLTDLPSLLEGESQKKQWLVEEMGLLEHMIHDARQNFQPENFSGSVEPLLQGIVKLRKIQEYVNAGFRQPRNQGTRRTSFPAQRKRKGFHESFRFSYRSVF